MEKIRVVEIFDSIEGEGSLIGYPTTFIRLEGCNLRCVWCDTKYSYDTDKYQLLSLDEILDKISSFKNKKVCLTGGEPLYNEGFDVLFKTLLEEGYFLIVETNGTVFRSVIKDLWGLYRDRIYIICSPKPFSNFFLNERLIPFIKEVKFVVDEVLRKQDILNVISKFENLPQLTFQPENNRQDMFEKARKLQKELLEKGFEFRLIPQVHKIFNLP